MESITQSVECLKRLYSERRPDGHWFDRSTMQFFKSRIGSIVQVGQVWLFVSSEKSPSNPRAYTIRRMSETGDIGTVGDFNAMTRSQAVTALRHAVADELSRQTDGVTC